MFVGQEHIIKELSILVPSEEPFNILFLAQPGQGKTLLGLKLANFIGKPFLYKIADNNDGFFNRLFRETPCYPTIFLDEIHRLDFEVEKIYPTMDSHKNIFIFATNQPQKLPEAFRTRVIEAIFARYTREELREMVKLYLPIKLSNELADIIIDSAEGNPRRINQFCIRIASIIRLRNMFLTRDTLVTIISEYFNIVDGLNSLEREYLSFLERVHIASLQTLTSGLGINKETIQTEIEPQLIYKGKIKITSKGREYVNSN